VGLFRWFSTKHELDSLRTDLDALKRSFAQVQQEWDATVDRVAKTLRRIRRAEQAQAVAEAGDEEGTDALASVPSSLQTSPSRLDKIREQLAEKGRT
jgi:chromosome segregation ATPase